MPAPDWNAERETLQFFLQKADKLIATRFVQVLTDGDIGISVRARVGEEVQLERRLPDDESVDAFVLTLRFFIQDNEAISIRNIAALLDTLPISEDIKTRVRTSRENLNQGLDAPPPIQVNNSLPSNRHVMLAFIYGALAHGNEEKRKLVDSWARQPLIFAMLNMIFVSSLGHLVGYIAWLREPVRQALGELPNSP